MRDYQALQRQKRNPSATPSTSFEQQTPSFEPILAHQPITHSVDLQANIEQVTRSSRSFESIALTRNDLEPAHRYAVNLPGIQRSVSSTEPVMQQKSTEIRSGVAHGNVVQRLNGTVLQTVSSTTEAMNTVGGARGDQTNEWNEAQSALAKDGLAFQPLASDTMTVSGTSVTFNYFYTKLIDLSNPFAAAYTIPAEWIDTILAKAQAAAKTITDEALTGQTTGKPIPTRFEVTIFRGNTRQQAFWTQDETTHQSIYRVFLRADKLMNRKDWGEHAKTSISGRESQRGWTEKGKKERFVKGAAVHEMGHMLHTFANPEIYNTATLMPAAIPTLTNADGLLSQKKQIATTNGQVMQALTTKNYKEKWGYTQANPAEVVAEVFTALMHGRNVPKGLAAVYVAYGGIRSTAIDAKLQESFGGTIPAINQPENAISIINQP